MAAPSLSARRDQHAAERAKSLGVTIEAQYTVGEYDIIILSAQQSGGLETWLRPERLSDSAGAPRVLGSYIKQNLKFFVAKVNLKEQAKLGYSVLRPIQVAYESPKFMLPIRLGHGQRRRTAGALRLRADTEGTRRSDELPDGEAADRHGPPGLRQGSVPRLLHGDVRAPGGEGEHERDLHRVRVGHGLVRSVRGRSAVARGAAEARRLLARRTSGPARGAPARRTSS